MFKKEKSQDVNKKNVVHDFIILKIQSQSFGLFNFEL